MLLSSAFLPEDVPTAFELLQGMAPEEYQPTFYCFKDTYFDRLTSQGRRQKPRLDMEQWSCHQKVKNDLHRTNNAVESWNSNRETGQQ